MAVIEKTDKMNNGFTLPNEVTEKTKLEHLNLNWEEKDLTEKVRTKHVHRLHPYLGKFIPQIVEIFLRKFFKPGDKILDPFCGSGTTLVQCNELGIDSIGYDISEFNVLLSKVKTDKYNIDKMEAEVIDIMNKVGELSQSNYWQLNLINPIQIHDKHLKTNNEYLNKWFAPQSLREILTFKYLIENFEYEYKDLLKIILSRSARSARLTTHFDLDFPKKPQKTPYWCYKHSRNCKPTEEAYKFIRRYCIDTVKRIKEFSKIRTNASVEVKHIDSREAETPRINGVITSPPYVGLINYHEQHIYAYELFQLNGKHDFEIGSATKGASQSAKNKYTNELTQVFKKIASSVVNGGKFIVIANDKYNLYDKIAEDSGLKTIDIIKRDVNRRTGRRSSNFSESIFIWEK